MITLDSNESNPVPVITDNVQMTIIKHLRKSITFLGVMREIQHSYRLTFPAHFSSPVSETQTWPALTSSLPAV